MKLSSHRALDALCAEYVIGTLRGAARKRFERAVADEPLVASRVNYWLHRAKLKPAADHVVQPSPAVWKAIARDVNLAAYLPPWYARLTLWRNWAVAASTALVLVLGSQWLLPILKAPVELQNVAQLKGDGAAAGVAAALSRDGKQLALKADRAVIASAQQSYELWLLPADGSAPISLAVLGSLDAQIAVPAAQVGRIARGAKLAVSVEPAGGSKTGAPTGPVILVGAVES
jgi:anti-sigma-K factor RskA